MNPERARAERPETNISKEKEEFISGLLKITNYKKKRRGLKTFFNRLSEKIRVTGNTFSLEEDQNVKNIISRLLLEIENKTTLSFIGSEKEYLEVKLEKLDKRVGETESLSAAEPEDAPHHLSDTALLEEAAPDPLTTNKTNTVNSLPKNGDRDTKEVEVVAHKLKKIQKALTDLLDPETQVEYFSKIRPILLKINSNTEFDQKKIEKTLRQNSQLNRYNGETKRQLLVVLNQLGTILSYGKINENINAIDFRSAEAAYQDTNLLAKELRDKLMRANTIIKLFLSELENDSGYTEADQGKRLDFTQKTEDLFNEVFAVEGEQKAVNINEVKKVLAYGNKNLRQLNLSAFKMTPEVTKKELSAIEHAIRRGLPLSKRENKIVDVLIQSYEMNPPSPWDDREKYTYTFLSLVRANNALSHYHDCTDNRFLNLKKLKEAGEAKQVNIDAVIFAIDRQEAEALLKIAKERAKNITDIRNTLKDAENKSKEKIPGTLEKKFLADLENDSTKSEEEKALLREQFHIQKDELYQMAVLYANDAHDIKTLLQARVEGSLFIKSEIEKEKISLDDHNFLGYIKDVREQIFIYDESKEKRIARLAKEGSDLERLSSFLVSDTALDITPEDLQTLKQLTDLWHKYLNSSNGKNLSTENVRSTERQPLELNDSTNLEIFPIQEYIKNNTEAVKKYLSKLISDYNEKLPTFQTKIKELKNENVVWESQNMYDQAFNATETLRGELEKIKTRGSFISAAINLFEIDKKDNGSSVL